MYVLFQNKALPQVSRCSRQVTRKVGAIDVCGIIGVTQWTVNKEGEGFYYLRKMFRGITDVELREYFCWPSDETSSLKIC